MQAHRVSRVVALLFTGLALCAPLSAQAEIYRVGSGSGCTHATIQAAIDVAATTSAADEIRLGTTQYNLAGLTIGSSSGTLALVGGYASCLAATPTSGQRAVLIGNGSQSVVRVRNARSLQLANLDLRQGQAIEGGGLDVQGSPSGERIDVVTLSNTLVRSNGALQGGGISVKNTLGSGAQPGNLQVILLGGSNVTSNTAVDGGGGIHCERATVIVRDDSHVGLNVTSEGDGGGILGFDCRLQLASRGVNGAVLWSNGAPAGRGGGLHLGGSLARAVIHTVDANVPARVVGNSAIAGGAIAISDAAQVRVYDAVLAQNRATAYGGAVMLSRSSTSGSGTSALRMSRVDVDAPAEAVACAVVEACNLVQGNRALSSAGAERGAAMVAYASFSNDVQARFDGTRFDFNEGRSLVHFGGNYAQALLLGTLLVNNVASGALFDAEGAPHSLVLFSSTIAQNSIGAGQPVIAGYGGCSESGYQGTHVRNSIVWQPQHALLATTGTLMPACFRHLIGADFGALPASAERVVADPLFLAPASGNFHVYSASPALDFAPARTDDTTRDGGPRVVDLPERTNLFGPQDAGAYERFEERIFQNGFECLDC